MALTQCLYNIGEQLGSDDLAALKFLSRECRDDKFKIVCHLTGVPVPI